MVKKFSGKEVKRMKRILSMLVAMVIALSLAACATTPSHKHSYKQIKCPACGYQFDTPTTN
jgi:ABC-type oligopeptide transport system substrate-binding subunit